MEVFLIFCHCISENWEQSCLTLIRGKTQLSGIWVWRVIVGLLRVYSARYNEQAHFGEVSVASGCCQLSS